MGLTLTHSDRKTDHNSNLTLTITLTITLNINPKHNPNLPSYLGAWVPWGDLQTVYATDRPLLK